MTNFDDLIIHFDKIYDTDYKEKVKFVIDAYVCRSKTLLPT